MENRMDGITWNNFFVCFVRKPPTEYEKWQKQHELKKIKVELYRQELRAAIGD